MIEKLIELIKSWDIDQRDGICQGCALAVECFDCPLHDSNRDKLIEELEKK